MAYTINDPQAGWMPISGTDAGLIPANNVNTGSTTAVPSPPMKAGMIVGASDPSFGSGEFILLLGVAATVVGSVVTYNQSTFQTALAPAGANLPQPIAVAMAANLAATWGWYQIAGIAVAQKSGGVSIVAAAAIGVATAGYFGASATGAEVEGALVAVTATTTATTIQVVINRPHMQGRIT